MQQHGIDAVIALRASRGHVHRRLRQGRDLCLQLLQPAAVLPILCGGQCLQHFILMLRQAQRLVGMRIEPVQQCLRPIGTHPTLCTTGTPSMALSLAISITTPVCVPYRSY